MAPHEFWALQAENCNGALGFRMDGRALAIGGSAIGRLVGKRARFGRIEIDDLAVRTHGTHARTRMLPLQLIRDHCHQVIGPVGGKRLLELDRPLEIRPEYLVHEALDSGGVGRCKVKFLVEAQAQLVEVG